jgi:hypothetical protein
MPKAIVSRRDYCWRRCDPRYNAAIPPGGGPALDQCLRACAWGTRLAPLAFRPSLSPRLLGNYHQSVGSIEVAGVSGLGLVALGVVGYFVWSELRRAGRTGQLRSNRRRRRRR